MIRKGSTAKPNLLWRDRSKFTSKNLAQSIPQLKMRSEYNS